MMEIYHPDTPMCSCPIHMMTVNWWKKSRA